MKKFIRELRRLATYVKITVSALYPWTIISFNISAKTMLGKLLIDNKYYNGNAKDDYEDDPNLKFECGKEYCENYLAKDVIRMGLNWYGLPSIEEMLNDLERVHPKPERIVINNQYSNFEDAIVRTE